MILFYSVRITSVVEQRGGHRRIHVPTVRIHKEQIPKNHVEAQEVRTRLHQIRHNRVPHLVVHQIGQHETHARQLQPGQPKVDPHGANEQPVEAATPTARLRRTVTRRHSIQPTHVAHSVAAVIQLVAQPRVHAVLLHIHMVPLLLELAHPHPRAAPLVLHPCAQVLRAPLVVEDARERQVVHEVGGEEAERDGGRVDPEVVVLDLELGGHGEAHEDERAVDALGGVREDLVEARAEVAAEGVGLVAYERRVAAALVLQVLLLLAADVDGRARGGGGGG